MKCSLRLLVLLGILLYISFVLLAVVDIRWLVSFVVKQRGSTVLWYHFLYIYIFFRFLG